MISSRGVAMIADFGNAQLKDITLKFSTTGRFSTTLRWTVREGLYFHFNNINDLSTGT